VDGITYEYFLETGTTSKLTCISTWLLGDLDVSSCATPDLHDDITMSHSGVTSKYSRPPTHVVTFYSGIEVQASRPSLSSQHLCAWSRCSLVARTRLPANAVSLLALDAEQSKQNWDIRNHLVRKLKLTAKNCPIYALDGPLWRSSLRASTTTS